MTNSYNRKLGIILQYIQMGLSILVSIVYTPVMLKILGSSEYGIYNLASSIISYLNLLSLGMGASYMRFYSIYKNKKSRQALSRLNGFYLIIFLFIGIVALICGVVLSNNVSIFLNDTYSSSDKKLAGTLLLILTFNLAWSFPASVFTSYVTAHEKFVFQKILNMIKTVVGPFLTLPLLLLGYGSVGMVMITTIVTVIADITNILFCFKKLDFNFDFHKFDFVLLKEVLGFSIFIVINQIVDQINWVTDRLILGKLCSSTVVAYYAIGAQVNTYFTQFSSAISNVFVPEINRIEASNETLLKKNELHTQIFTKVGKLQFIILSLILTGFAIFGKTFIYLWAGEDYNSSYYVALLLMAPAIVPLIQNIGIEIQRAKNLHQFRSLIYLIMAIINVAISIPLAMKWEEIGAAYGTAISLIVANGVIMNIFYYKVIKIDIPYFWKQIFRLIPAIIISFVVGKIIFNYLNMSNVIIFIMGILIYVIIYGVFIYFMGFDQAQKNKVYMVFHKLFEKRKLR